VKDGSERAEAVREAKLNSNALWRDLYTKVETTGEETVDGEPCYKLVMTPTDGEPETLFISKKTGLAVKMAVVANTQLGSLTAEILFGDYKTFGGILTPAKITEKTAGQEITITIDSVEVNPEIPASQFAMPPDVAALTEKSGPKI
jgi:outer membrane lipoprotein-sorting protein